MRQNEYLWSKGLKGPAKKKKKKKKKVCENTGLTKGELNVEAFSLLLHNGFFLSRIREESVKFSANYSSNMAKSKKKKKSCLVSSYHFTKQQRFNLVQIQSICRLQNRCY